MSDERARSYKFDATAWVEQMSPPPCSWSLLFPANYPCPFPSCRNAGKGADPC